MPSKTVLTQNWDVIVSGGGPGGVCAAATAARQGAAVLLIERHGYLGGMATAGLVNPFMPYTVKASGQNIASRLKQHIPAFKNAYLQKTAGHIGVRESRRVMGGYVLNAEDVLTGAKFEDGIARSVYPVDIHNPSGTGTVLQYLADDEYYEIPFRCLAPRRMHNLLIGSRCISATHEAHSSLRVMPVVAGIGEAAGIAAALAVQRAICTDQIDGRELKPILLKPL